MKVLVFILFLSATVLSEISPAIKERLSKSVLSQKTTSQKITTTAKTHYGNPETQNGCLADETKLYNDYYKAYNCVPKCDSNKKCPLDTPNSKSDAKHALAVCVTKPWFYSNIEGSYCILTCGGWSGSNHRHCPEGSLCSIVGRRMSMISTRRNLQFGNAVCLYKNNVGTLDSSKKEDPKDIQKPTTLTQPHYSNPKTHGDKCLDDEVI